MNVKYWFRSTENVLPKNIDYSYSISEQSSSDNAGQMFLVGNFWGNDQANAQKLCSQAVKKIKNHYYRNFDDDHLKSLKRAFELSNQELLDQQDEASYSLISVVSAVIYGDSLFVALVGNAYAYHVRGAELKTLVEPVTGLMLMYRAGVFTEQEYQEAQNWPGSAHRIRSFLLMPELLIETTNQALQVGDYILLGSAVAGSVGDEISRILGSYPPKIAVSELLDLSVSRSRRDEATLLLIKIED